LRAQLSGPARAQLASGAALGRQLAVTTTIARAFQRPLSRRLEQELPVIKMKLAKLTGSGTAQKTKGATAKNFAFEVQVDVVALEAESSNLLGLVSLKTAGGRALPNRSNVNPPAFIASVAKPLITAKALSDNAVTLHTVIRAADCAAPDSFRFPGEKADERPLPLANHLVFSRNPPFICVANALGIRKVQAAWRELFPDLPPAPPHEFSHPYELARGLNRSEASLTPTQVAEAYTALANQGQRQSLRVTESIFADGKPLLLQTSEGRQVFKPEAASLLSSLLRSGAHSLPHWKPRPGFDLALKTGSSSNSYLVVMWSPRVVFVTRYLILPAEPLNEREAQKFEDELKQRFAKVFSSNVVKPFADMVLETAQRNYPNWLRGTFTHENLVTIKIDPEQECATGDDSGLPAQYIKGTEPRPCLAEEDALDETENGS
jgi:membrane peptidoglycan carboxypeptidase